MEKVIKLDTFSSTNNIFMQTISSDLSLSRINHMWATLALSFRSFLPPDIAEIGTHMDAIRKKTWVGSTGRKNVS